MLSLAVAGALSGCAAMGAPSCGPGGQPELVAEMVFGRNIGDSPEFRKLIETASWKTR